MPDGKYDLRPLIHVHFVDPDRTRRGNVVSWTAQLAVPLVAGIGVGVLVAVGLPISNGITVALPATSLLVGAMFGAFVFLTNLRVKLAESATYAFRADLQHLVGRAAAACLYVALAAMFLAAVLAVVGSVPALRQPPARPVTVAVLVLLGVHVGMSLVATMRQMIVVYLNMFSADFNPKVGGPSTPQRADRQTRIKR